MKKNLLIVISFLVLVLSSCAKQDEVYKEFLKDGGLIYPAKALNLTADRGYQRIVLKWDLPMDPSIRTAKLYWDSRTKSMDFDYSNYPSGTITAAITELEDRSYTFEVINYDAAQNASLASEITSSPFGESWLVSHAERSIKFAEMDGNDAVITLGKPTDEITETMFRYETVDGKTVEKVFLATEDIVRLPNAKKWKYLDYQSSFCPAEGIDTVWISNWSKSPYPIATKVDNSATVTVTTNQIRDNFKPELILDGIKDNLNSSWYSSNNASYRSIFPKILVIDTKLIGDNALTFNHFVFYENSNPDGRYIRTFNLYVGDSKFNPDDTSLMTFGEPVYTGFLTQLSDVQDVFLTTAKRGRYIAIVFRNSYNTSGFINLWEFEAYGYVASNAN